MQWTLHFILNWFPQVYLCFHNLIFVEFLTERYTELLTEPNTEPNTELHTLSLTDFPNLIFVELLTEPNTELHTLSLTDSPKFIFIIYLLLNRPMTSVLNPKLTSEL
jgi:hypothetical protein